MSENESITSLSEGLRPVLQRVLPGFLDLTQLERLSAGASQETYRIEISTSEGAQVLAMRRAAGGVEAELGPGHPGLAVEAKLMQVAAAADVPEPEVYYVLQPQDGLGAGFIMQWLDGFTLGAQIVKVPELAAIRPQLAYQCGEILGRIHSIDLAATGLDQQLQSLSPEAFIHQTWDRYKTFNTPQPMIDYAALWLLANLPKDYEPRLVHNDFRNGNFMVTAEGINAVLDWEVAHIGDAMRDLGWICTHSWRFGRAHLPVGGFGEKADLFAGYEAATGRTVDPKAVHYWQVFGSFWWAVGCLSMAEHYRNGPDQSVERPGIGRRSSECQMDCVNLLFPGPVTEAKPAATDAKTNLHMPNTDELLSSVIDFLRDDVMSETAGRTQFMARVAANSLAIVQREMLLGESGAKAEWRALMALLPWQDAAQRPTVESLRWQLIAALRQGDIALSDAGLQSYLRNSVLHRLRIDQPRYPSLQTAIAGEPADAEAGG